MQHRSFTHSFIIFFSYKDAFCFRTLSQTIMRYQMVNKGISAMWAVIWIFCLTKCYTKLKLVDWLRVSCGPNCTRMNMKTLYKICGLSHVKLKHMNKLYTGCIHVGLLHFLVWLSVKISCYQLEAQYCLRTFCSTCGYLQLLVDGG